MFAVVTRPMDEAVITVLDMGSSFLSEAERQMRIIRGLDVPAPPPKQEEEIIYRPNPEPAPIEPTPLTEVIEREDTPELQRQRLRACDQVLTDQKKEEEKALQEMEPPKEKPTLKGEQSQPKKKVRQRAKKESLVYKTVITFPKKGALPKEITRGFCKSAGANRSEMVKLAYKKMQRGKKCRFIGNESPAGIWQTLHRDTGNAWCLYLEALCHERHGFYRGDKGSLVSAVNRLREAAGAINDDELQAKWYELANTIKQHEELP